jgi:hypothetical protein
MGLCALFCKQRSLHNSRYAIVSKQHRLKPPPLHSTNLKKEKGFFFSFLLDLKRPYLARITSVASAKRDATLMNAKSVRFFEPLGCPPHPGGIWHEVQCHYPTVLPHRRTAGAVPPAFPRRTWEREGVGSYVF